MCSILCITKVDCEFCAVSSYSILCSVGPMNLPPWYWIAKTFRVKLSLIHNTIIFQLLFGKMLSLHCFYVDRHLCFWFSALVFVLDVQGQEWVFVSGEICNKFQWQVGNRPCLKGRRFSAGKERKGAQRLS